MDEAKREIIRRFMANVYGRRPVITNSNPDHDGRYGHWLETQMGITHNGDNAPDLLGFEMKNDTTSGRTTFGDWSPNMKIYGRNGELSKENFVKIFGHPSTRKANRWSWSGEPVPKNDTWNKYGQKILVDDNKNISIIYNYGHDERSNKHNIVPEKYRTGDHVLMSWTGSVIKEKVENKFNDKGWFKCKRDRSGVYNEIVFGAPFTFERWIELVLQGIVFLDPGLYYDEDEPQSRPYMMWRAKNTYWDAFIIDRYPK